MDAATPLPALFISHGSPMTALEPREAGAFMQRLGPAVEREFGRPMAIVAVSAHSLTREPVLLAAPRHEAVYDFGGFDPKLYTLRYDAPGAPALAQRVAALLAAQGMPAHVVAEGGLDHGIWTPLRYMFPDADVPVLPLAWPPDWAPERLFALGAALAPLAAEGVLVLGSGSITHNLRRVFAGGLRDIEKPATPESTAFREWFRARAEGAGRSGATARAEGADGASAAAGPDWAPLFDYRRAAPHAELMHPTDEHLLPWYVAAGAGGRASPARRIHESLTFGDLGMDAYAFGPGAGRLAQALAEPR